MKVERVHQDLIGLTYDELIKNLTVFSDDGDGCGYADVDVNDCLKDLVGNSNAILRDVTRTEYEDDSGASTTLNFIFDLGDKTGIILGYELSAGSGSGWSYGAHCTLSYKDRELAEAYW